MRSKGKKVRVGRFVLALCVVALLGSMLPAHAGQATRCERESPVGHGPFMISVNVVGSKAVPVAPAYPFCTTPVVECGWDPCVIQGTGKASSATGGAGLIIKFERRELYCKNVPLCFVPPEVSPYGPWLMIDWKVCQVGNSTTAAQSCSVNVLGSADFSDQVRMSCSWKGRILQVDRKVKLSCVGGWFAGGGD